MKFVKTLLVIVFVSGIVIFFQNCSVQQNTGLLGSKEPTSTTAADKVVLNAPFAYDLVVDTISYNSCVGESLNDQGVHGIKMGVNEGFTDNFGSGAVKAGLKLRSDFLQYIGKNLKPRYPSTVITPAQIQNVLVNSESNKDVYLQFAVRKASNLSVVQDVIQPSGPIQFSLPRDGLVLQAPLFLDPVLSSLTKNVQFGDGGVVLAEGSRVYDLQSVSPPVAIAAAFSYSGITDETLDLVQPGSTENLGIGERYSETVRNKFNLGTSEKYILAITYGALDAVGSETTGVDNGLNSPKRKVLTDLTKAYGRGFNLKFGLPVSPAAAGWKNNALKTVSETNLIDASPASGSRWDCRSYVIMKRNQWNNQQLSKPSCAGLISTDLLNASINSQVKNLRRQYLEADWDIGFFYDANTAYDPNNRLSRPLCLVPKKTECYLPTSEVLLAGTDVGVNYNPNSECYLTNQTGASYTNSLDVVKAGGRCAQFASICVRTSTNF